MSETIINGIIEESQEIFGRMQYARGAKGDDGIGISDISKTSTVGKVDTYTITLTDGTTKTFTVTNGDDGANGISVSTASINSSGHLILTLSNGTSIDAGVASEVYIGTTPPTDPSIKVWIDTSGEAGDVEMTSNKVTSISSESTDIQYPSAKAVANIIDDIDATFANALKGTASGSVLKLNDVSPAAHTMGVNVSSKNLFDYSGVNFTRSATDSTYVKENNGFTLTAGPSTAYFSTNNVSAFHLKPNTTYTSKATVTLTDNGSSNIAEAGSMRTSLLLQTNSTFDSSDEGKIYIVNGSAKGVGTHEIITTFTTPADMTDFQYVVTRLSNNTTVIFKDIQIECGSTATDYTPYISDYTAAPEKQWQQVFSSYCEFSGSSMEFYLAPVYKPKTFDIVVGKEYTLETSGGMQGPNGLKYTCTAVANSYGGYSIKCDVIRVETCSEEYAQQMISAGRPEYSEWIDKFRIAWVSASYSYVDFDLTIKEYAGDITKAVKVSRCGKNLFDTSKISGDEQFINNGDGTLTIKVASRTVREKLSTICPTLKVGDKICFSFTSNSTKKFIYLLESKTSLASYTNPHTVTQNDLDSRLVFYGYQSTEPEYGESCTISNIQIEYGTAITDYEPCICEDYTPTADGTVNGVTSLYPRTNLSTNVNDIVIECEYNRDINKAFAALEAAIATNNS